MDWTRGRTLGRGSSAAVSIATSGRSGDTFAVKSVELSQSQFLQREQKMLASLNCPHIVSYRGCDITSENNRLMYNLFMEYASGGTLTDEIRRRGGRIDESTIGFYARQIMQGLEYLHSCGVVHCDIKCRNILIGESGVKIADLGCARRASPVAGAEFGEAPIGGTPMFMAPEVARGEEQGFPADIWAFGCAVIEMATGESPWPNATDPVSVLYRIAFSGGSPEFPDALSDEAKDFLSKCLNRAPTERWTAKELLKHPFLEEINSNSKQSADFDSNSPTSILDQRFWSSMEETETEGDLVHKGYVDTAALRIRRLSSSSGLPNWTWEEDWITIRSNDDGRGEEGNANCGSVTVTALNKATNDLELEGSVSR